MVRVLGLAKFFHSLTSRDFLMAGQIFLLVFLSTFPVVLPLILFKDIAVAMRVSNGVALALMFAAGYSLARYSGLKPFFTALAYTAIGVILVGITIILGDEDDLLIPVLGRPLVFCFSYPAQTISSLLLYKELLPANKTVRIYFLPLSAAIHQQNCRML